jgi:methylthioribulose-1-phosphate dehydratase
MELDEAARQIVAIARDFYARGWALGTSGNFSAVISREPMRLAITASGVDKGSVTLESVLEIDANGRSSSESLRPSSESGIHLVIAQAAPAGAVLHTHSVWSTILSEEFAKQKGLAIAGYEMLKGLSGVKTHLHSEWLAIIENTQDWAAEAAQVEKLVANQAQSHGFLIRGHGLYTWGRDLNEAKRHVEILEFLLEVTGRLYCVGRS